MENRKISFLVRNLLSIINLAKILTNNERFRNLKKRWLWWLKWRKKLTMNIAKKWCMTELFFVLFFFRSFVTNVFILCCYVTLHVQHTQPLSDEKNEQNQMKDFFFFDILCFTMNYCLLKFVSIINLFLWELLSESSLVS